MNVVQWLRAGVAASVVLLALDLMWLGLIMDSFYRQALGNLRATQINVYAAAGFYSLYLSLVLSLAYRATSARQAATYGAVAGFYAYGVYELTNLAVIEGWPLVLVLPDWAWGVVLTGVVTAVAHRSMKGRPYSTTHP